MTLLSTLRFFCEEGNDDVKFGRILRPAKYFLARRVADVPQQIVICPYYCRSHQIIIDAATGIGHQELSSLDGCAEQLRREPRDVEKRVQPSNVIDHLVHDDQVPWALLAQVELHDVLYAKIHVGEIGSH